MIVGIETSALSNRITGTSRYITCLLEQLKTLGDDIKLFSAFHSVNNFLPKKKGVQKFLYRNLFLKKEMDKEYVDYAFFPDYFMPKNFTIPSAIIIHDLSFVSHPQFYSKGFAFFYKYQLKETLKNSPLILTISEYSRKTISEYLDINIEKIRLLQAYSSSDGEINYNQKKDKYLLFVGHIEPRKNLYFLIKTFLKWKEITGVDLKLIIAGELWIKNEDTMKILYEFRNHTDVEFKGYVEELELSRLYRNASGFVHTSFVEGFCLPVLEAMHNKLPIICSSNTAAEEISAPYSITIDPWNDKSMLEGLDRLYQIISAKEKINYEIKYSSSLMKSQLVEVIDILKSKIKSRVSVSMPSVKNKEEAIEKTLLYSGLFNSGIKKEHLHKSIFDVEINKDDLESLLLKLYIENKIYFKDDTIFLNNNSSFYKKPPAGIVKSKNKKSIKLMNFIPFISSISFSGGTAHYGYENHDDIDLFIITKPNALYIVYALIHVLSLLLRVRKELCANYLIDERGMEIKYPHDFYTAHQIISLKAFKNENILNRFFDNNTWIQKYFPNFFWKEAEMKNSVAKNLFLVPINKSLKILYRFIYRKQLAKNQNKTSLKLEEHFIKLHTNDHRQRITEEFYNSWKNYKARTTSHSYASQLKEKAVV